MLLIYYINRTFIHLACDYLHIRPGGENAIKKKKTICYVIVHPKRQEGKKRTSFDVARLI